MLYYSGLKLDSSETSQQPGFNIETSSLNRASFSLIRTNTKRARITSKDSLKLPRNSFEVTSLS